MVRLTTLIIVGNFFGIIILQLWVAYTVGMGFDFFMIAPLLPSCCGFYFVFGSGVSFFGGFQHSPAEKTMAPHSITLAWKIPWMEEPGRLKSIGS